MRMRANPERTLGAALVVEDDDMIAQLLQLILQREGYTPARAWTRRSILSYMADQPPPQLITVRSPFSRPSGPSIGASRACPAFGSRQASSRSSHASAPAPDTQ